MPTFYNKFKKEIMSYFRNTIGVLVLTIVCLMSCKEKPAATIEPDSKKKILTSKPNIRRFGMVTGLKPEKIVYYKELHAHAWPQVQKMISECNIQNYSIYLQQIKNDYFLFSYFEYVGTNFDSDMKKMAADTTTQRWWRETDPTQLPLPEALKKHEIWTNMEEVFHQD